MRAAHAILLFLLVATADAQDAARYKEDIPTLRKQLAQPAERRSIEAYQPGMTLEYRRYASPRPIRLWIMEVDLTRPDVRFAFTPPQEFSGDDAKFETACDTTLGFAEKTGTSVAINTSAFGPFRARAGLPMEVVGLAAVAGERYSPAHPPYGAMYISKDHQVTLKEPPLPTENLWHVVPGFRMVLDDERICVDPDRAHSGFGGINPRTAVGTDKSGKRLWIVVVDGRQKEVSMGMTLVEMAILFDQLGAYDALNLDGGGSSTLVMQDAEGNQQIVNTPVGVRAPGTLRQVANNLGLHLPGKGPRADALPRPAEKP